MASKPHRPCASGSQRPGRRCEEPNGMREAFALPVAICRVLHDGKTVRCRTGAEAVRGTATWASNSGLYAGRWSMTAAFGTGRSARPMPRGVRVGAQKPVAHPLRSSSRGQSAGRGGLRRMIHGRAFPTVLPWAVVRRVRENGSILATKPSSGTDRPRSDGASALSIPPTWAFAGEERPLRAKGRVRRARARFRGQKSRVSPHGGRAASGAPGEEGGCAARESRWRRGGRPRRARGQRGPAADARGGAGARRARRATGTSVLCLVFRTSSREPQGGSAPISGTRFGL